MPVYKFRSIEAMNAAERNFWLPAGDPALLRRIDGLWKEGTLLLPPLDFPRGVIKYRSFEEENADRERHEKARIARLRAERESV